MRLLNALALSFSLAGLLAPGPSRLEARTKKGDQYLKQGRQAQLAEDWDNALDLYEKALAEDPSDATYQIAVRRTRFQASQEHLKRGKTLRDEGKLDEALAAFQRAFVIDPSSTIAQQEMRRTYRLIKDQEAREKEGKKPEKEEEGALLPPAERLEKETEERISSILPVPELKPISRQLNTLRMNNQPVKVLYETVGKLAGINVVFDPEFQAPPKNYTVDLTNATLEDALNYLAMLTKTFWKPLSENTIFVTNDNVTKRRDYDEMVVQVFYLANITKVQELQEIATAVRSVTDIRRLFTYNSQNAILVRGTKDQVALAEKLIHDLDKPLAEVVVDVIVMEANRARTRDLAAAIVSGTGTGISLPIFFSPRGAAQAGGTDNGDGGTTGGIRLGQLGKLTENDWSTTLPGALLQALMTDRGTRILQRPQVRAADGQKASLRLGDRFPYATGSFQPGVGAVGVSPLVSTQFQFADVGVNVDLTPKIHGEQDVSLHVEIEISTVKDSIDIGGLSQPIIGQRKVAEDIRVREGEVTLLGGLTQDQRTRTKSGVPGLADIPIIKWLGFSSEGIERNEGELLIALIPYIVRRPDISELNLRGVAAGSDQVVQLRYAPPEEEAKPAEPAKPEVEPVKPEAAPAKPEPEPAEPAKPPAEAPPGAVGLSFNPPEIKVKRGDTFTVALVLDNAADIFNAPMKFKFDPKLLRMNEVARGSFMSSDGQQVIFTRNILNDSGDAAIILNRMPGSGGVSGSGTLVTLTFQAVEQGATQVTVPDLTLRDSQMQPVPVTAPVLQVSIE